MHRRSTLAKSERNRALAAGFALAAICAASLYLANHSSRTTEQMRQARTSLDGVGSGAGMAEGAGQASGQGDDDNLTTGSVLFVPVEGNVCRRRFIDNRTWALRDAGHVVCDEAVSWNSAAPAQPWSAPSRIEAIRHGFNPK
jgi:hypothetical protein